MLTLKTCDTKHYSYPPPTEHPVRGCDVHGVARNISATATYQSRSTWHSHVSIAIDVAQQARTHSKTQCRRHALLVVGKIRFTALDRRIAGIEGSAQFPLGQCGVQRHGRRRDVHTGCRLCFTELQGRDDLGWHCLPDVGEVGERF